MGDSEQAVGRRQEVGQRTQAHEQVEQPEVDKKEQQWLEALQQVERPEVDGTQAYIEPQEHEPQELGTEEYRQEEHRSKECRAQEHEPEEHRSEEYRTQELEPEEHRPQEQQQEAVAVVINVRGAGKAPRSLSSNST